MAMAITMATIPPLTDASAPMSIPAGLARVEDELEMALKWKRPSIILIIAASGPVYRAARAALQEWLELRGERVERFSVARHGNGDIPLLLSRKRLIDGTVYFIERLAAGGEPALRALNLRREYFVDHQVRAVFFLNASEEKSIAQFAPDFWAFRHLVVYLQ